jgi:hypothetical protein
MIVRVRCADATRPKLQHLPEKISLSARLQEIQRRHGTQTLHYLLLSHLQTFEVCERLKCVTYFKPRLKTVLEKKNPIFISSFCKCGRDGRDIYVAPRRPRYALAPTRERCGPLRCPTVCGLRHGLLPLEKKGKRGGHVSKMSLNRR